MKVQRGSAEYIGKQVSRDRIFEGSVSYDDHYSVLWSLPCRHGRLDDLRSAARIREVRCRRASRCNQDVIGQKPRLVQRRGVLYFGRLTGDSDGG